MTVIPRSMVAGRADGRCVRRMCALLYALEPARPTVSRSGAADVHGRSEETTMLYRGSCHCGDVKFDAQGDLQRVMACNCSICRRKGALMWFVPLAHMTLLTPEENLATYTFNKHVIRHRFCKRCGIHAFGEGVHPDGTAMAAINVRCLDDVDIDALPVTHFDGRSL
jgi:hypothetical protein